MENEQQLNDRRLREVEVNLATHEAVCAERYGGIQKETAALTRGLDDLKVLMIRIAIGIGFGMASILASIAFKV